MKIAIVVQARMNSERLPGKVMKPVLGKTLIAHEIERLERSSFADEIVLATTENPADEPLAAEGARLGVRVYRGSEEDVLARFYYAAKAAEADAVIRVTGDCPLIDPLVIDRIARVFVESSGKIDYVSNIIKRRTFPRGMDCEVFSFAALERAHAEAASRRDREHVTPYIYTDPDKFKLSAVFLDADLSEHRWTVDTPEDFKLIENILTELYPRNRQFSMDDVARLMDSRPDWYGINRAVAQKESSETLVKNQGKNKS